MKKIPLSALDLSMVVAGGDHSTAIQRTVSIAKHTETLGYNRIWLAEHHNMEYIASSATSVLIGHVAQQTKKIRVGSGGIMLPNHAPLAIAEQFGTLAAIYPRRIDLGLGRAPGTDQLTAMALRRNNFHTHNQFKEDILALQRYFSKENAAAAVRAFPGEGQHVPLWILGSSTDSAFLAAEMGLPYAFASHFAPAQFYRAIDIYKKQFKPSVWLKEPYIMACINIVAADTDAEANYLASSMYQTFSGIITNVRQPLQPPVEDMPSTWSDEVAYAVEQMLALSFIGSKATIAAGLEDFIAKTGVDELMTTNNIFDEEKRLYSATLAYEVMQDIAS